MYGEPLYQWCMSSLPGSGCCLDTVNHSDCPECTICSGANKCVFDVNDVLGAGCLACDATEDCDDGNVCTTDACVNGACTFTEVLGCCENAGDCEDGDPVRTSCVSSTSASSSPLRNAAMRTLIARTATAVRRIPAISRRDCVRMNHSVLVKKKAVSSIPSEEPSPWMVSRRRSLQVVRLPGGSA